MTEEELEKLSMEAKLLLAGGKYWEKKGKRMDKSRVSITEAARELTRTIDSDQGSSK